MNRRKTIGALAAAITLAAPFSAKAEDEPADVTYIVPKGVNKLRVRSYVGDNKVIDTTMPVEPGQKFRINAV